MKETEHDAFVSAFVSRLGLPCTDYKEKDAACVPGAATAPVLGFRNISESEPSPKRPGRAVSREVARHGSVVFPRIL